MSWIAIQNQSSGGTSTPSNTPLRQILVDHGRFSKNRTAKTVTNVTYVYNATIKQTGSDLELIFANGYDLTGDQGTGNTIQIGKCVLEYKGQNFDVTFKGNQGITIQNKNTVKSDKIFLDVRIGDTLYVKTFVVQATGYIPNDGNTFEYSGDTTATMGMPYPTGVTDTYGFAPIGIVGDVATADHKPTYLLLGDSITQGYGDGVNADQLGFAHRIVHGLNYPFSDLSRGGESTFHLQGNLGVIRRSMFAYATHVIIGYATNDIGQEGSSLAKIQSDMTLLVNDLKRRGVQNVYLCTCVPRTNGSTADTQTPLATDSIRKQYNTWVRTKPIGITDYIEMADVVETARDSGIWQTQYWMDGIHPNQAGHTAIATANMSKFA